MIIVNMLKIENKIIKKIKKIKKLFNQKKPNIK